jgi:hypothetical protein
MGGVVNWLKESCPVVGFGICYIKPSGPNARDLV